MLIEGMNVLHIHVHFGHALGIQSDSSVLTVKLILFLQLVSKFICLLGFAFTTKAHILKYRSCQKKQNG